MIKINHLYKSFGRKEVLHDIDCELEEGVYGLLGPNGAGKTTLMRCLTNLYPLSSGSITINGVSSKRGSKLRIGYLPQFFGLYKELTVWDSMRYFCNLKKVSRLHQKETIEHCLEVVNMNRHRKTAGRKLSGGMIRRVGIAQALIDRPELVLFDEPTAGLDPEERMHFKNVISNLGKSETVIISTHIVEDIEACCDRVIVMKEGSICCVAGCDELVARADGKVFACKKEFQPQLKKEHFIEKQYEEAGEIYYRILAREEEDGLKALPPTLEDGYMCVIKNV
jgi:ABC-2 type transport system ATP-binding protein